uniref:Regulator of G protein signaling 2 n=1 Tax=Cyprinus carpio TaxID=7962 RepID=A0A8C1WPJ8_CYPCA
CLLIMFNRETNWRSRMFFKTFPVRKSRGLTALRLFMKSEHSEENIEFWMACEEFKKIRSRSKLKSRAKTIYDEFIRPDSPKEINLDFYTRESLHQSLLIPTQWSFKAHNSHPRFLDSELYQKLCRIAAGER